MVEEAESEPKQCIFLVMKVIDGAYKKRPQLNGDRFSDRYYL